MFYYGKLCSVAGSIYLGLLPARRVTAAVELSQSRSHWSLARNSYAPQLWRIEFCTAVVRMQQAHCLAEKQNCYQ